MARQKGVIKLEGQIGDLTFYKTQDGFQVREKTGISADRIKNDPSFARTRENGAEFGRAGKAGKLLRTALRTQLINVGDKRVASRLTRELIKVIQADATNPRGLRNVIDGECELLKGFEFNEDAQFTKTFLPPILTSIDRAGGMGSVRVPGYVPTEMIVAPGGATHYNFIIGLVAADFESGTFKANGSKSALLPLVKDATVLHNMEVVLGAGITTPMFLVFGIEFSQHVNGDYYALRNGSHNSLAMVEINGQP
jgi:hypothetical protein